MRKLAAIFLLLGACHAADAGSRSGSMLYIDAEAVEISGGALNGLKLRGTMNLTADPRAFGGFSGLHIDGGRLSAITDHGWLLQADLKETDQGLIPVDAAFAPMLDIDGAELDRAGRDAEGLTIIDGDFAVSFERDHRIMFRQDDGRLGQSTTHRAFEALGSNKGLEALATTADDAIIAIAEESVDGAFPMHLLRRNKGVVLGSLPALSRHNVTGADVGEDQRLYLLLRDFSPFRGVSMRILRYDLGTDGFPIADTATELADFESASGIDNMEGIAVWEDEAGRTRLTLISDDNFNLIQRTLLMDFEVLN